MLSKKQQALKFLEEHKDQVERMINDEHKTYLEIQRFYQDELYMETWWIGEFSRKNRFCAFKQRSYSKLGDKNPAKNPDTKKKISESVKKLWADNVYDDRLNGMLDAKYMKHPLFKMIHNYKEKLDFYEPELKCMRCGKDLTNEKYDTHHVDEDHSNILLSNLERLCISCHQLYHTKANKLPYVTVEIQHELQYGHRLPDYDGKCYFTHGHRGIMTLRVRRRIDSKTGFAIDFNVLKTIIKEEVDDVLDHEYLNNYMDNPTTENTVIWLWLKLSRRLKGIESISFAEGSKTCITITKEDMNEAVLKGIYESDWIPEEYREKLDHDFDTFIDLPDIDNEDDYTIQASIDHQNDWKWYYDIVRCIKEIEKEKD